MKTSFVCALFILGLEVSWGQSEVDFRNGGVTFPTPADRFVYRDFVGGEKLIGEGYVAGLWYAPGANLAAVDCRLAVNSGVQAGPFFPFRRSTTLSPGTWLVPATLSPLVTLPGVAYQQPVGLQVRVWDSIRFSSFLEAFSAGEYGVSEPFAYTDPGFTLPSGHYMDNLRAFALVSSVSTNIFVQDLVVAEGSNGVYQADFKVGLYAPQVFPISVDFSTTDGTAVAGQDYVAASGTLTFAPGETTKIVSITLTADAPAEPDEKFELVLSNPVNGSLSKSRGTCTITEVRVDGISVNTEVSFNTVSNHRYAVERSFNGIDWEVVPSATNIVGSGEIVTIVDRGAGCQSLRTYRARLLD